MSVIQVISTDKPLSRTEVQGLRDIINGASKKHGKGNQKKIENATGGFDNYWGNWTGSTRYWYYVPNEAILILNVWDTYCYVVWVAKSPGGRITPLFDRVFSDFEGKTFYLHVKKSKLKYAYSIYRGLGFEDVLRQKMPATIRNAAPTTSMRRPPEMPPLKL